MKLCFSVSSKRGTVLVVTLILALLVSLVAGALLKLSQHQNYLTARSMTWSSEIPMAEAGIEEAMAHLNSKITRRDENDWQPVATGVAKTRFFSNDYFYSTISAAEPPVIVSIGYGRIPLQTNYTTRKVMAITAYIPTYRIVGKSSVTLNGTNPKVDSYSYSNGFTFHDHAGVGSPSTNIGAINAGSAAIYGYAATGPGGTVNGTVGSGSYIAGGGTGIEPYHVSDDFNMAIPDAVLPSPWAPKSISSLIFNKNIGGKEYNWVVGAGDWILPGTNFNAGGIYISANARIHFTGDLKLGSSASITLAAGSSVEMYLSGTMDLAGSCVVNSSKIAADCRIYGLPTCTSISYYGNSAAYCQIYAPSANVTVKGNSDFFGSAVGNNLTFSGSGSIHSDEGVRDGPDYKVVLWEEL